MRPHTGHDTERPAGQECGGLAPVRIRSQLEKHHLAAADHEAGDGGGDEMAVVDVERLQAKGKYQDEGAGEES